MELLFHCQFVKKEDNYCTYSGVRCESCSLVGFCCSWECFGYKNGYKQSCYGDGAQLPSLWIRRPSCYIRKHAEGDAVYEDAYYAYGYKLYGRGDMMTTLRSQLAQHLALILHYDNMKKWKHAFFLQLSILYCYNYTLHSHTISINYNLGLHILLVFHYL